jgi:hypothetical protein
MRSKAVVGYKVVRAGGASLRKNVVFVVGKTYELSDGVKPVLNAVGFHFCRTALDCIKSTGFKKHWRVLRVTVPDGAAIVNDATDYAASKLVVEADVTADVVPQMTGTITWKPGDGWTHTATVTEGLLHSIDDHPALVRTHDDGRHIEAWYDGGRPSRKTPKEGHKQAAVVVFHPDGSCDEHWLTRGTVCGTAHYDCEGVLVSKMRWRLNTKYM